MQGCGFSLTLNIAKKSWKTSIFGNKLRKTALTRQERKALLGLCRQEFDEQITKYSKFNVDGNQVTLNKSEDD